MTDRTSITNAHQAYSSLDADDGFRQTVKQILAAGNKGEVEVGDYLWRLGGWRLHTRVAPAAALADLEALKVELGLVDPPPPPPPPPGLGGLTGFTGRALTFGGEATLGIGASAFTLPLALHRRPALMEANGNYLRGCGVNYLRARGSNGGLAPLWGDYRLMPGEAGYWPLINQMLDWCRGFGFRLHLVVLPPDKGIWRLFESMDEIELFLDDMAALVRQHEELFVALELVNEEYQSDDFTLDELRHVTRYLQARVRVPVLASSPFEMSQDEFEEIHHGGVADALTAHLSRKETALEGKIRSARQGIKMLRIYPHLAWFDSEHMGFGPPHDHDADNSTHNQLLRVAAAFFYQAAGSVVHIGNDYAKLEHGWRARYVPEPDALQRGLRAIRQAVPAQIQNGTFHNNNKDFPGHPFFDQFVDRQGVQRQSWTAGSERGIQRASAVTGIPESSDRLCLLAAIRGHVDLGAGDYRVIDLMTGDETGEHTTGIIKGGETWNERTKIVIV